MEGEFDTKFIVKFVILFIPFTIFIWNFAPTFKWKILYTLCGVVGIGLALTGKSMRTRN